MRVRWQRKGNADLERALVSGRPVPREELVQRLLQQIGHTAPAQLVPNHLSRRRRALAGVLTVSMLVFLAAFGGVGYAKASCSRAAHSAYHAVVKHHHDGSESGPTRDPSSSDHSAAWYREHPHPGYFCGTKGKRHELKLILTQQRYDRLVKSGWKLIGGPFSTEAAARHSYPNTVWRQDDGAG